MYLFIQSHQSPKTENQGFKIREMAFFSSKFHLAMVRPYQGDRVQCPRGSYAKKIFVATVQFFYSKFCVFGQLPITPPGGNILNYLRWPIEARHEYIQWSKDELPRSNQSEITA